MANKILIFLGEKQVFDVSTVDEALFSMPPWNVSRRGPNTGALLEYQCAQGPLHELVVRVTPDAETITIDGDWNATLSFALALQAALPMPLRMIDMGYNFDVALTEFGSIEELRSAVSN